MILINKLIDAIKKLPNCQVMLPVELPSLEPEHVLSEDLKLFYEQCGGMDLFVNSIYPFTIPSPQNLVLANPVMFQGVSQEDIQESKGHISWSWYIVAQHRNSVYITIDLAKSRLGTCYNSEWVLHPSNSYPIAQSFT